MEQLRSLFPQSNLVIWALLLVLGIPLSALGLNEWMDRWQRQGDASRARLAKALANFRNLVLPLLSLRLILVQVFQLGQTVLIVRVVETLFWIVLLYSSLYLITQLVRSPGSAAKGELSMPRVWGEVLRLVLVIGIGFYVLGALWGAPMGDIVAALGVGSIVIGFALQDTLSSVMAGMLLAFEKPFEVGHWVRQGDVEGQVIEMNWRAVRLRTRERDVIIFPNALIGTERVINYTLLDPLHADLLQVSFGYNHPPNQIKPILLEMCRSTPGVCQDPVPHVRILSYAYDKYALNYEIKYFVTDYLHLEFIRDEILTRIYYATQRNNLTVPYPATIFYHRDGAELKKVDDFQRLLTHLQNLPYLATLPKAALEQLAHSSAFHYFGIKEWALSLGTHSPGLYILLEGEVRLVAPNVTLQPNDLQRNGYQTALTLSQTQIENWRELDVLHAGEFFGELLLLRNRPSPYAVEVMSDTVTIFIERSSFMQIVESNPRLAQEMNRLIEERDRLLHRGEGG